MIRPKYIPKNIITFSKMVSGGAWPYGLPWPPFLALTISLTIFFVLSVNKGAFLNLPSDKKFFMID
jgi:hypothetical protein